MNPQIQNSVLSLIKQGFHDYNTLWYNTYFLRNRLKHETMTKYLLALCERGLIVKRIGRYYISSEIGAHINMCKVARALGKLEKELGLDGEL